MTQEVPAGARPTLFLAFALMFLGTCGACSGASSYEGMTPSAQHAQEEQAEAAGLNESTVAMQLLLTNDPRRQPLAIATVALSALLLFAGAALLFRRTWAPWFTRQIVGAKVLLAVASAASSLVYWLGIQDELAPYFEAQGLPPNSEGIAFVSLALAAALPVLFSIALHGFLAWRVGRKDVREFMGPPEEHR